MLVTLVAQWYKPVMSFLGKIHDLSMEYPDALFAIIDLDESKELVKHLGFLDQPGMRLYLKGQKVTEFSGMNTFNNPPELETILRFEIEKQGVLRVEAPQQPDVAGIIQQAIQLAKPGAQTTLKLRPSADSVSSASPSSPSTPSLPKYRYFPNVEYQAFTATSNMTIIETKTLSFAENNASCSLTSEQVSLFKGLIGILSDEKRYSSSNFEDGQLELLRQMLETWPVELLFPVLDLFRLAVCHPIGRAFFLNSPIIPKIIENAKEAPFPYQFMAFKTICNLFDSRITKQLVINLFESVISLCNHLASNTNKNLQLVSSTLLLNYVTFLTKEGINDEIYPPSPLINALKAILTETQLQSDDAIFRIAIAVGTLHLHSPTAKQATPNLLNLLNQHAEILRTATPPLTEHTSTALVDLATMLSSSSS
jgi:hypothetical protein